MQITTLLQHTTCTSDTRATVTALTDFPHHGVLEEVLSLLGHVAGKQPVRVNLRVCHH